MFFIFACLLSLSARGQSMARIAEDPWDKNDILTNYGNPVFENGGHVAGSDNNTEVQWSDNWGRLRLDRNDDQSPFIAYRFVIGQLNSNSDLFHSTMDDVELAAGFHLGTFAGWKVSTILGAGYDSTHPFVNEKGIFGIGDVTAVHRIDDQNSILLAVDYAGNNAFLPDVPLPGFAVIHHDKNLDFTLGFPVSQIEWRPIPKVKIRANYAVPYAGGVDVEYLPWKHFGFYGNAANVFQGVVIAKEDSVDRQFFQMRRVELGVRVKFSPLVDAGIGIGYAFDQSISDGYDVRSLRGVAHLTNEPYISVVLHGRF
jgi:hypothetical protein